MKKRKIILPLILLFVLFTIGSFLQQKNTLIRPQLLGVDKIFSSLEKVVSSSLNDTKGTYAVFIKNMASGKGYEFNKDRVFEPGSLYKLWVMGTVFEKIQKGEIKEEDILSQNVQSLNREFDIEEGDAELTEGYVTMSVSEALNQMITISHNYAALLLAEKVKNSEIKKFMEKYGFNSSDLGSPPHTTASDIALFFEKLYKGEIVNLEYSQKMIDLLKQQKLNDGLPRYLPKDLSVAHKTGEIGWFKNDGGIVFTKSGDYIIVILSESESPLGAQQRIAEISRAVYQYFTK